MPRRAALRQYVLAYPRAKVDAVVTSPLKLLIAGAALCLLSSAAAAGGAVAAVGAVAAGGPALASGGGTIEHWGAYGTNGNQYDKTLSPVSLSLPAPVLQVASSNSTQYALLTNGTVYAWGLGTHGELGDGNTENSFTTAVRVQFPAGVKIASIPADVMPYDSAFAVDTTGHAWAWGDNAGGEFCLANTRQYTTPVELPFSDVTALAGAAGHATYDSDGTLYSCGTNSHGELGDGTLTASTVPVQVSGLSGKQVSTLVASWGNAGALLSDGDYDDWGYNGAGQVGNGTVGQSAPAPVQVSLPAAVTQAAQGGSGTGGGQTLVLLSGGALYAWGSDSNYQLGDGKTTSQDAPERISPPSGVTYQTVASGGTTSYAITTTGKVYAWGANAEGQVGDGKTAPAQHPVKVETGASLISATADDILVGAASN
jgi:alpha-tubulin suppressor-like RCC1 family protein